MTVAGVWTEVFRIRSYEIDPHGHVSMPSLCNYFQEIAGQHAQSYGVSIKQLAKKNLTWVLARLHLEIESYPSFGNDIRLETWPSGHDGLYATRDVLFYCDEEWIGRGTSAWLLVDVMRKRPIRIPDFIKKIQLPERDRALTGRLERPTIEEAPACERHFIVRYGDLDINQHANNVCYAEWALETVPVDVLNTHQVHSLELHFRAESVFGDDIISSVYIQPLDEGKICTHQLKRGRDGKEVALARSFWRLR